MLETLALVISRQLSPAEADFCCAPNTGGCEMNQAFFQRFGFDRQLFACNRRMPLPRAILAGEKPPRRLLPLPFACCDNVRWSCRRPGGKTAFHLGTGAVSNSSAGALATKSPPGACAHQWQTRAAWGRYRSASKRSGQLASRPFSPFKVARLVEAADEVVDQWGRQSGRDCASASAGGVDLDG